MTEHTINLPEEGTMVRILTKSPTLLLNAFYCNNQFKIQNHWALKSVPIENIEMWDYIGQS